MATTMLALAVTVYMVMGPAHCVRRLMDLTHTSVEYSVFLVGLSVLHLAIMWTFEKHLAMPLARCADVAKRYVTGKAKRRKEYKTIREDLWRAR